MMDRETKPLPDESSGRESFAAKNFRGDDTVQMLAAEHSKAGRKSRMTEGRRVKEKRSSLAGVFLLLFSMLAVILGLTVSMFLSKEERPFAPAKPQIESPENVYLQEGDGRPKNAFSPADIPRWLLVHMGVIAAGQVLALVWAAWSASSDFLSKRDARKILFLCELPMYLGLFGTLLGVCMTQFVTGSLVAPLAYCTTMTGVLLHVIGKLGIWLKLPEELIDTE